MKINRVLNFSIVLLFVICAFSSVNAQTPDIRGTWQAIDKAQREKRYEDAAKLLEEARTFLFPAASDIATLWQKTAENRASRGLFAEALKECMPYMGSVTNLSLAPPQARDLMTRLAKAAIACDDMKAFDTLCAQLAKEPMTPQIHQLWGTFARAFVEDATAFQRKPRAEQLNLVAAFREAGSTFGLNIVEKTSLSSRDDYVFARFNEAVAVIDKLMPKENLTAAQLLSLIAWKRDFANQIGKVSDQDKANAEYKNALLNFRPQDLGGTNLLLQAFLAENPSGLIWSFERAGKFAQAAELCDELISKRPDIFEPHKLVLTARKAALAFRANDEATYKAALAIVNAAPPSKTTVDAYAAMCGILRRDFNVGRPEANRITRELFERHFTKLDEDQQFRVLCMLANGDYQDMRESFPKIRELIKKRAAEIDEDNRLAAEARENKTQYTRKNLQRFSYNPQISAFLREHDFELAIEPLIDALANPRVGDGTYRELSLAYLGLGKGKEAAEIAARGYTNTAFNAQARFFLKVCEAAGLAASAEDFGKKVRGLRGFADSITPAGESNDKFFFDGLRAASKNLFVTGHFDYMQKLVEISDSLKWPEERVNYVAKWLDNAPTSAEGAARAGIFDGKIAVEKRFAAYMMYTHIDKPKEYKLLKSNPQPKLDDLAGTEKEAGIVVAYNDLGVYVYMRFKDPQARDIAYGLRGAAGIEIAILPGEGNIYQMTFFNSADPTEQVHIEWNSVGDGYKRTDDNIKRSSYVGADATYACVFYPWNAAYESIPQGRGEEWKLAIAAGWAGEFRIIGGGQVHELGRGLHVKFDMPPNRAAQVRVGAVKRAVAEYRKVRGAWENADFWADPHIGDADFFEKVIKPWLAELDAEAKKVESEKNLSQAEFDRLFRDRLREFTDFKVSIDDKRAEFIRQKLFAE